MSKVTKFIGQVLYLLTQVNTWLIAGGAAAAAGTCAVAVEHLGPVAQVAVSAGAVVVSVLASAALVVRRSLTISNDPGARFVPSSTSEDYKHQYDSNAQDW